MNEFTPPDTRVAIVTGAARGIGASIATRLAQDGHDVAVLDLDATACSETLRSIERHGRRSLAVGADVTDEAAVTQAVAAVAAALGPPTVLVNNAGVLRTRVLSKMSLADWDVIMAVHLRGAFLMTRAVLPHLRAAQWGRIINLSSISALGTIGQASYSAAKAGLQGYTKTLAIELGRYGVTANAVAPGFIMTAMTAGIAEGTGIPLEELKRQALEQISVGRVGEPEDVAHAVAFFADPRSSFVTGQVLYVAGGPRA